VRVYVDGIGLMAPGLETWPASGPVLRGAQAFRSRPLTLPPSPLLPANERRRMVTTVKLALQVGAEAFASAGRDPAATATVFTSSGGDGETIQSILEALATAEFDVSPTRFHNSVHNAPSGYWAIANQAHAPTTSLCAHDASFSAGLLDAAIQATVDDRAVALIAYDLPYPEPLNTQRRVESIFGVALILTPAPTSTSLAGLTIARHGDVRPATTMTDPELETLRAGNPAARSLPLLAALARGQAADIMLEHVFGTGLAVSVMPPPW
jgi:hypothetical protein